ncbi:MAG: AraC family transcriptional regulator [Gorillibacterium sp.]|nr:AraC family transcriptional regulator [Gorillibacterium sp.]
MIRYTNLPLSYLDEMLLSSQLQCVYMHLAEEKDLWECKQHTHEYLELGYIFKGSGLYQIDGVNYQAQSGELFVIPPGVPHFEVHTPESPFEILFLMVKHHGPAAAGLDAWMTRQQGRHSWKQTGAFRDGFQDIYREIMQQLPGYLTLIDAKLKGLYTYLFRREQEDDGSTAMAKWSNVERNHQMLNQIEQFVQKHDSGVLTVEAVAQHFFYHPKYLSQVYKLEKGRSLSALLSQVRMDRVLAMLTGSSITMEDVASSIGFSNVQSLYKWFKKETGLTPLEYRNTYQASEAKKDLF